MQTIHILAPLLFIVAILIVRTDKRIVRALRRAGANHPGCTTELDSSGALRSWRLRRFMSFGVVVELQPGQYYLNEDRYLDIRKKKVMIMLAIISAALIITVLFLRQG